MSSSERVILEEDLWTRIILEGQLISRRVRVHQISPSCFNTAGSKKKSETPIPSPYPAIHPAAIANQS